MVPDLSLAEIIQARAGIQSTRYLAALSGNAEVVIVYLQRH